MKEINKIIVGTHNNGKFKEICDLLPKKIIKISPKDLNLFSPNETGSTFEENSKIKAEYFTKKANLIRVLKNINFTKSHLKSGFLPK